MTEAEWWAATDPRVLVVWLLNNRSPHDRKMRLFAHACSAHLGKIVTDWPQSKYLVLGEQFIERHIDRGTVGDRLTPFDAYHMGFRQPGDHIFGEDPPPRHLAAREFLSMCWQPTGVNRAERIGMLRSCFILGSTTEKIAHLAMRHGGDSVDVPSLRSFAALFREMFGPLPFRDVPVAPEWLTSDVTALARGVYDDKAFDRMPILADALQDAGCDSAEILAHCRGDGPHVRGCWVIDLLLGRPWREQV